jgi:hypothetical protein
MRQEAEKVRQSRGLAFRSSLGAIMEGQRRQHHDNNIERGVGGLEMSQEIPDKSLCIATV